MQLHKGVPVLIGSIHGFVFGGPFRKYEEGTRRLVGVKMAAEIDHPHEVSIPTDDFSVPTTQSMQAGILEALRHMRDGNDIYVGCMGGIGRTGLFMGCLAKLMQDCSDSGYMPSLTPGDPVKWVRSKYIPHAIETKEQQDFVRTFDTEPLIAWIDAVHKPVTVEVQVPKVVTTFPPLFEYVVWWLSGGFMK